MENKNYVVYEYMSKTIARNKQSFISDTYEAFGWRISEVHKGVSLVTITFRRERRNSHKNELNRLEKRVDDVIKNIDNLEKKKTKGAQIFSLVFGIVSSLIFGGGLCLTMLLTENMLALVGGILLGVVGGVMMGITYLIYRQISTRKTLLVEPIIEDNLDKLSGICNSASLIFEKSQQS